MLSTVINNCSYEREAPHPVIMRNKLSGEIFELTYSARTRNLIRAFCRIYNFDPNQFQLNEIIEIIRRYPSQRSHYRNSGEYLNSCCLEEIFEPDPV